MELHQLRYFCAVARFRNFTRAAESEHVAQPSLSQQVLKLEDELGTRLFDRLGRDVRLTEAGRRLLPRVQQILQQVADAKHEVLELSGSDRGEVTVGVIPTIAPYYVPARIAEFRKQHPNIQLRVVEETTPTLLSALREGTLDLAVVALPEEKREFRAWEIGKEELYAALPKSQPLSRRKTIQLAELECAPFLLLKEGHCFRGTVVAACKRAQVPLNTVFESGQFATILAMVAVGAGVSIVPAMAVHEVSGCAFVRIDDPHAYRRFGVIHLKQHYLTRAQTLFVKALGARVSERPIPTVEGHAA